MIYVCGECGSYNVGYVNGSLMCKNCNFNYTTGIQETADQGGRPPGSKGPTPKSG